MVIGNPMIFRQLPLEMALRKMVELGYDALELWPPQIGECRTPELRRRLAEHVASLGLKLVRLNAADPDYFKVLGSPADVPAVLAGLKADIDAAAELGMSQLLTYEGRRPADCQPGRNLRLGARRDRSASSNRRSATPAPKASASRSRSIPSRSASTWIGSSRCATGSIRPDFGVVYDCCHFGVGLPKGYVDAIRRLGHRIHHVHFSDSDRVSSEVHYAPGTGCLDLLGHCRRPEGNRLPRHHDARPVALSAAGRGLSHRRALRGRGAAPTRHRTTIRVSHESSRTQETRPAFSDRKPAGTGDRAG